LLPDGRVLLVGGRGDDTVERSEVYDPVSNTWTVVPTDSRFTARQYHTATLMPNGQVLVAGGLNANSPTAAASIYNPVINNWQIGPNMNEARCGQGAVLLTDSKVLVAGSGCDFRANSAGAEEFDSASNRWARVASLNAPLGGIAVALGGGRALFIGETVMTYPGDVEMFVPA
jgi:N-acetylneuraminic acid mutarotase